MEKGNNKEITKGDNPRDRKPGKVIGKHHQQKTRDSRENLRCRKYFRKHWHNSQRKCKMQNPHNQKYPGNPGHNKKTKPKDNMHRRKWRHPTKKAINIFNRSREKSSLT